jgi:hypothetical protein
MSGGEGKKEVKESEAQAEERTAIDLRYALAGLVLLSSIFLVYNSFFAPEKTYYLEGMKIISKGKPGDALKGVLSPRVVVIEEHFFDGNDSRNSAVAAMGAEVAGGFAPMNRTAWVYGSFVRKTTGKTEYVNCIKETNFCSNSSIVVSTGDCNCLRITPKQLFIEGSEQFLQENRVKVRAVIMSELAK